MSFPSRVLWSSVWIGGLMLLTVALAIVLQIVWDDRAWAEAEAKYWFGVGVGLVIGRYFWWHEKFNKAIP